MEPSFPHLKEGNVTMVTSPVIIPKHNCLSFVYQLNGENIGRLDVYREFPDSLTEQAELLWRITGNYGNEWREAKIPVFSWRPFRVSRL